MWYTLIRKSRLHEWLSYALPFPADPPPSLRGSVSFFIKLLILLALAGPTCEAYGQTGPAADETAPGSLSGADAVSEGTLRALQRKYSGMGQMVERQTLKFMNGMEKQEADVTKKLPVEDSAGGRRLMSEAVKKYAEWKSRLSSAAGAAAGVSTGAAGARLKEYIPGLDSLQTALHFMSQGNLPAGRLEQVQALSQQLEQLEGRLQVAGEVQSFATVRMQQLKDQLGRYTSGSPLSAMNMKVYYYQQQLAEYKEMLNDKGRLEQAVLSRVSHLPAFRSFIQKNGMLARLFPAPAGNGSAVSIAGLQTSADVQKMISQRVGGGNGSGGGVQGIDAGGNAGAGGMAAGGHDPRQFIDQQVQAAQSEIDKLKGRLRQLARGGGSTTTVLPDLAPNNQRTKPFLKRLEFGLNIQNTPGAYPLPVTSAIAGTVGYRMSDKAVTGVGVSYNLGWGSGLDHIHFTSQGIGLRSFLDIRAKGSIWVTGGFEYNYMQQFAGISDLRRYDLWQKSALLGLTKKYRLKKMQGNLQLLYDLLAAGQRPQASPLKFRVGYNF
ncbi:MAG TPA: hypothetical protein VHE34_09155 [Puia sp.]|uniref:hypothetical protein n=1 Tax=Puia sp. TaxID=2045100 RepID=UPI002C12A771|nr:hypothetical protein [Puia sp.]HVU95380.1 hypothetical protein [Puia sp.]